MNRTSICNNQDYILKCSLVHTDLAQCKMQRNFTVVFHKALTQIIEVWLDSCKFKKENTIILHRKIIIKLKKPRLNFAFSLTFFFLQLGQLSSVRQSNSEPLINWKKTILLKTKFIGNKKISSIALLQK